VRQHSRPEGGYNQSTLYWWPLPSVGLIYLAPRGIKTLRTESSNLGDVKKRGEEKGANSRKNEKTLGETGALNGNRVKRCQTCGGIVTTGKWGEECKRGLTKCKVNKKKRTIVTEIPGNGGKNSFQ